MGSKSLKFGTFQYYSPNSVLFIKQNKMIFRLYLRLNNVENVAKEEKRFPVARMPSRQHPSKFAVANVSCFISGIRTYL